MSEYSDEAARAIEQKVHRKLKRTSCPFCDNTNWFVLDQEPAISMVVLRHYNGVAAFSFACTNCGFVRQHVRPVVTGDVTAEVTYSDPSEW